MAERLLILTGARSEFGLLAPVYRAIAARAELEPLLVVTGVHLLAEYGSTERDIEASGIPIARRIPFYLTSRITDRELPAAIARGIAGVAGALEELSARWLVVLGDRAEAMAAALAAYAGGLAIAHIHGGEKTDSGHTDEGFRHAISRLAHLHLTATAAAAERLRRSGEEEWRIHRVGAPGLEAIRRSLAGAPPRSELAAQYGLPPGLPLAVFLFHPDRLHQHEAGDIARMALAGLLDRDLAVLAVYPNSDPGSQGVLEALEDAARRRPGRLALRRSLPRDEFHAALARASVLVGNSSAGIIEAPSFGLPVVNIGERNRNREHGANAIFIEPSAAALAAALDRALGDEEFRARCARRDNPYGDGNAARRIAEVLAVTPLDERLLTKHLTI